MTVRAVTSEGDVEQHYVTARHRFVSLRMSEIFGIPTQALFGQLLIGLINGSFYALLSLGPRGDLRAAQHHQFRARRPVHDGRLLRVVSAEQGWGSATGGRSLFAPIIVGATGVVIERLMLARLYKLDHLYGLLLTFGLALVIQGLFRNEFGSSGLPYPIPPELTGGHNLGFMFLPNYRAWVVVASLVDLSRDLVRDRAHQARLVPAGGDRESGARAGLRHQRAAHDHAHLRLRRGARRARRRDGGADLQVNPLMGADLIIVVFAVVVIGGMGSIMGSIVTGFVLGLVEGLTKVFYPEASNTVIFIIMAIVLMIKPAGLFGRQK